MFFLKLKEYVNNISKVNSKKNRIVSTVKWHNPESESPESQYTTKINDKFNKLKNQDHDNQPPDNRYITTMLLDLGISFFLSLLASEK